MAARGRENADEAILLALACGATYAKAAQEAGVGERTVRRRMADADFRDRLYRVRCEMLERAGGALTASALRSVQTLLSLQEKDQPPAVRLGAARAILEIGMKVREVMEVTVRMDALEARIGGLNQPAN